MLEGDGLVSRTIFPTIPPQVEYDLMPLGHSPSEPVIALGRWAMAHTGEIEGARAGFDARPGAKVARKRAPYHLGSKGKP